MSFDAYICMAGDISFLFENKLCTRVNCTPSTVLFGNIFEFRNRQLNKIKTSSERATSHRSIAATDRKRSFNVRRLKRCPSFSMPTVHREEIGIT